MLNMIIRTINIKLIDTIGYNYNSQRVRLIMQSILYAQYFNSSILLMLCTANFENTPLSWIPLREQFHDTTISWYILFGPAIIKTMGFYAVFPYIDFAGLAILKYLFRFWDSGCFTLKCCCYKKKTKSDIASFKTKKTTMAQFVNLYSGPEILMYFKYSNVINLVFSAFTHGIALPILWPICFFGIINNYFCERCLLAYYYKQPPMYDNRLNDRALNTLKFCPVIFLMMGYWYLGNR